MQPKRVDEFEHDCFMGGNIFKDFGENKNNRIEQNNDCIEIRKLIIYDSDLRIPFKKEPRSSAGETDA